MQKNNNPAIVPADDSPTFDVAEFVFFALGRFRYYIVLFAAVGFVYGIAGALKLPNTYSSEGQFLVRSGERERRTPETSLDQRDDGKVQAPGLWEEIHLLNTPVLYQRLAEAIGPERIAKRYDPTFRDDENTPWATRMQHELQARFFFPKRPESEDEPTTEAEAEEQSEPEAAGPEATEEEPDPDAFRVITPVEAAGRVAMARTTIEPLKMGRSADTSSRVITIRYEAYTPELAQDAVRKLMDLCKERHKEVFSAPYQDSFISKQLEKAEKEEEEAREKYFEHVDECGFFDIPKQKSALVQNIERIGQSVRDAEIQREVARDELDEVNRQLPDLDPVNIISSTMSNPAILRYLDKWWAKDSEIMNIPYSEGSVHYKAMKEKLERERADIWDKIRQQQASLDIEGGTEDPIEQKIENDTYEELVKKGRDLQWRLSKLKIEIEGYREIIEDDTDRLTALLACEPTHDSLDRDKHKALVRADQLIGARGEAEVLDLMDQDSQLSNLKFVQDATYNPIKLGPSRSRSVIMGLFGGIALGVVFAFLRQILDSKLRFPGNIERTLGLRVLGVIPEQRRWRRLGRRVRKAV
jgi:uncharacterized protein involved in exopolysaccharide biosynthesis